MGIVSLQLVVLADDLTGALEAGAFCAEAGFRSRVIADPRWRPGADAGLARAVVVDTETRHSDALEASERIEALARWARGQGARALVKKTDSTLRGNIPAELAAVARAYSGRPLLYIPAYPRLGRTVRGGKLFVGGEPLDRTSFARDPLDPIQGGDILELLREGQDLPVFGIPPGGEMPGEGSGIWVADGEEEDDVARAAQWLTEPGSGRAAAGPAGLVRHLAGLLGCGGGTARALPRVGTCVIVNGSRHEASAGQILRALEAGWPAAGSEEVVRRLGRERWMILRPDGCDGLSPLDRARRVALQLARVLGEAAPEGLVVFGGDTAFAALRQLGFPGLEPLGEALPGCPLTRVASCRPDGSAASAGGELILATKAGGFGAPDLLTALRERLAPEQS